MNRLAVALIGFAALAALEVETLRDWRLRGGALAVLAMFAVLTWTAHKRKQLQELSEGDRGETRGLEEGGGKDGSRLEGRE